MGLAGTRWVRGGTLSSSNTGGTVHNTTKLAARLVQVTVALALAFGTAAAQVDTMSRSPMLQASGSSAAGEGAPIPPAPTAAGTPEGAAPGDSLRLIAQLLVANGAPERRAGPVAAAVLKYARLRALDPLLVVGIIGVENAELVGRSRSRAGATGVMQVMPHWKRDIRDCGGDDLRNVHVNVCFATRILRIALDASTSVREALLRYNGCVRAPGCTRYASAVFSQAGRAMLLSRLTLPPAAPPAPVRAELAAAGGT